MDRSTRTHPRLSPVNGKPILLGFDGVDMSSDAGLTLLREIERKAGLSQRLADCLSDPRDPAKVQHILCDIIRFRVMMIAAGYEDGNDAASLRLLHRKGKREYSTPPGKKAKTSPNVAGTAAEDAEDTKEAAERARQKKEQLKREYKEDKDAIRQKGSREQETRAKALQDREAKRAEQKRKLQESVSSLETKRTKNLLSLKQVLNDHKEAKKSLEEAPH